MVDIKKVADNAEMIVNGYAFTICEQGIRVLNLNNPDSAALLTNDYGWYRNPNRKRLFEE